MLDPKLLFKLFKDTLRDWANARSEMEMTWQMAYSAYAVSEQSKIFQDTYLTEAVGDVGGDWRHKVNTGGAYEVVETILAYFLKSFFPTPLWFDIEVLSLDIEDMHTLISTLRKIISDDLNRNTNFKAEFTVWLRTLIITGFSVLQSSWEESDEYEQPVFTNVSPFHCWVDPLSSSTQSLIRIRHLTKAKFLEEVEEGNYNSISLAKAKMYVASRSGGYDEYDQSNTVRAYAQIHDASQNDEIVSIYEWWGTIECRGECYDDMYCVFTDDDTIHIEEDVMYPFVVGAYTVVDTELQPYSMGGLQPVLGLLYETDRMTNQRLDGIEVSINPAYGMVLDGVLDPETLNIMPGDIIPMADPKSLFPLNRLDVSNLGITYQEIAAGRERVSSTTGLTAGVGTGGTRNAERVTAQEVIATREIGGTRLTSVFNYIDVVCMSKILNMILRLYRDNKTRNTIARVSTGNSQETAFYEVPPENFSAKIKLRASGAESVIERSAKIQKYTDLLTLAGQVPQMAQLLDYSAILMEMTNLMGFDDPQNLLLKQDTNSANNPIESLPQDLQQAGGQSMQNAAMQNMAADGGASLASLASQALPTNVTLPQPTLPQG